MEEAVPEGSCRLQTKQVVCHHVCLKACITSWEKSLSSGQKGQRGEGGGLERPHQASVSARGAPSGSGTGSPGRRASETSRKVQRWPTSLLLAQCLLGARFCVLIKAARSSHSLNLGGRLLVTVILPKGHQCQSHIEVHGEVTCFSKAPQATSSYVAQGYRDLSFQVHLFPSSLVPNQCPSRIEMSCSCSVSTATA